VPLFPPASQAAPSADAVSLGQGANALGVAVPNATASTAVAAASSAPTSVTSTLVASPNVAVASQSVASAAVPGAWITFTAQGESWVEATSATGAVLIRRTLQPGESVSIAGAPPVNVTMGQARNTRVTVRGNAFDTSAFMRQDVARFTLK
jgi:cytoskeleton protein RodZ